MKMDARIGIPCRGQVPLSRKVFVSWKRKEERLPPGNPTLGSSPNPPPSGTGRIWRGEKRVGG